MIIRLASAADAGAVRRIYAAYIGTPVTFEYELPTESDFVERIESTIRDYPFLVCEDNGKVVGYAYAHRQMERDAYQWNAELSVYISPEFQSRGLGKLLDLALMRLLKLQGIKTVYAGVTLPNQKSERLHLTLGFHKLGVYHKTGYKCGNWHDVAWYEKKIAPYEKEPAVFLSIQDLSADTVEEILFRFKKS